MKIPNQEAHQKHMESLFNAAWAAPDSFAGAADAISKEMAKPIRRWAITIFVLWIIGGLLSLALSIGTLALTVWVIIKVLQLTGVL